MAGKYTHVIGHIRFYPDGGSYENKDDFDGVVMIRWLDDHTVEFVGACGTKGVSRLGESIKLCSELGATRFRASRTHGHRMPRPWRIIDASGTQSMWELILV